MDKLGSGCKGSIGHFLMMVDGLPFGVPVSKKWRLLSRLKRVASSEADGAASTKKERVSADSKAEQVEE